VKCPESIEELKDLEKLIPLCKVTLFEQAQARKEKHPEKSDRQIEREIASELDRNPETIHKSIQRAKQEQLGTLSPIPELNLTESDKTSILHTASQIRKEKKEAQSQYQTEQKQKILNQPVPKGKYQTIVIDPPWPMEKIIRDARPNQVTMDYPTMTIQEIVSFKVPTFAADNCHIYLWTTHKFLPVSFHILEEWGFKYECLLTWSKNVGMTPFSWMYSTEHCLFGRKGSLPLLKMGKRLDFVGKVREHSRKPEIFYDLVKEVSPEPRIDIFSREKRIGFDQFGNEQNLF